MADMTLLEAVEQRGPYADWDLMDDDEKKAAAVGFWNGADRESRSALEMALAAELKFRQQSVRQLSAEKVAGRLVRLADSLIGILVLTPRDMRDIAPGFRANRACGLTGCTH